MKNQFVRVWLYARSGGKFTWGPCSMPALNGSPMVRLKARVFAFSTNSSYILSCTNVREQAAQHCHCRLRHICQSMNSKFSETCLAPTWEFLGCTWLKNKAKWASSTASSTLASSHTMTGDFPPSSKVTGLRLLPAANWRTEFPVTVDPVKASCH